MLTNSGFLDATRNTDHDDITIGSLVETTDGIIPNDICIDENIGSMQLKIIAKHGEYAKLHLDLIKIFITRL